MNIQTVLDPAMDAIDGRLTKRCAAEQGQYSLRPLKANQRLIASIAIGILVRCRARNRIAAHSLRRRRRQL